MNHNQNDGLLKMIRRTDLILLRTAKFIAPSLHIQNNSIIFVLCSRALDRTQAETVIQKADVHTFYL